MPEHPYGWLSILPPIAAIVLAIVTRRVVLSLIAGLFVGALILAGGNPVWAVTNLLEQHLWTTATDPTNLRIFAFTLLMGGMVAVISGAGGMRGLINLITPWAKDRRRGQLVVWLSGLLIFFDDYANTIVLGNTLRSLTDRLRISREKLSFLVDSTAAPVAGIAPLSTWVAWEIIQISEGLKNAGAADEEVKGLAFELFIYSIPYRFYAIWMLIFVPLVALLLRDFGPMRSAERKMIATGRSSGVIDVAESALPKDDIPARWYNAALPIGLTLGLVVLLLYQTGYQNFVGANSAEAFAALSTGEKLREILGEADSPLALAYGAFAGLALAAIMANAQRLLSWGQIHDAVGAGMKTVLPAIAILITAMTLSGMTKGKRPEPGQVPFAEKGTRLYTGVFLGHLLLGDEAESPPGQISTPAHSDDDGAPPLNESLHLSPKTPTSAPFPKEGAAGLGTDPMPPTTSRRQLLTWLLPTIVFLLSSVVSFCTGTSYGTMGILMPMTISLAYSVLGDVETVAVGNPILLGTISGVLAGSIFGDHCSPISDTTVLSSQASGCDHLAHVWTQMPYAVVVGMVAVVFGTLPIGFGVSVWWLLPLGVAAMIVLVLLLGWRDGGEPAINRLDNSTDRN